jgi:uncharacterized protein YdeI (YjbR/CyaY-like superfamily)
VSPLDVSHALPIETAADWDDWLRGHPDEPRDVVIGIFKKSSGRQRVSFVDLLEVAMLHGWVDTQTKSIDDERYAIRYVRRRAGSNWSEHNRELARRLLAEGRMSEAGIASLPPDL